MNSELAPGLQFSKSDWLRNNIKEVISGKFFSIHFPAQPLEKLHLPFNRRRNTADLWLG